MTADTLNKRPRRYKERFKLVVILAKGLQRDSPFLYHLQEYQRGKWVYGLLNMTTKKDLIKEIKALLAEMEAEIMGTG